MKYTEIKVTFAGEETTYLDGDMWGCVAELKKIGFKFEGGRWTAKCEGKNLSIYDIIPVLAKAGKTVKHPVEFI